MTLAPVRAAWWSRAATAVVLLLVAAGCTVVRTAPEPLQPRVTTGPPPSPQPPVEPRAETSAPLPVEPPQEGFDPVRRFDEVRALWVVRYTMTSAEAIRAMIRDAETAGINTLIVQVRGRADAFYRSNIEPRGESIVEGPDFDPLALTIAEAHARGMAVHAWVNTHLVWGPGALPLSREHLVNAHPDWLAVPRALGVDLAGVDPFDRRFVERLVRWAEENPATVEGLYSSPSHPEVQDRVHAVWLDLATRYDLDGIHFDYIRFPSAQYDYSVGALERFRLWSREKLPEARWVELDAAYEDDLFGFVDGESALWAEFRREQVTRLVSRIRTDVKLLRPRLVVSAAVIADPDVAWSDRFQDWRAWLRDGLIDIAVPMAYTSDATRFEALVRAAREAAGTPERIWAGIGAYMNPAEGTLGMIDIARAEGAGGVVLFSYDWAAGEGQGDPTDPLLRRIGRARFGR